MPSISALRRSPHFAHLFAHVHPLCWPILLWSLARLFKWFDTAGFENVLYSTSRWGFIRIAYLGDRKADPSLYRGHDLEKPRWDDPVWFTSVPACLASPSLQSGEGICPLSAHANFASQGNLPPPHAVGRARLGLAGHDTS